VEGWAAGNGPSVVAGDTKSSSADGPTSGSAGQSIDPAFIGGDLRRASKRERQMSDDFGA
jgi:hypothetical protein